MKSIIQLLPGIKFIGFVNCDKLQPDIAMRGICGMDVPILTEINAINFVGSPTCECTSEKVNGNRSDTATLKFTATEQLPINAHLGFVVTDSNGNSYVIGCREVPYPKVKLTSNLGKPDGDAAGYSYEVTHVQIKSLIPCII
jgi:hypothetical protein